MLKLRQLREFLVEEFIIVTITAHYRHDGTDDSNQDNQG